MIEFDPVKTSILNLRRELPSEHQCSSAFPAITVLDTAPPNLTNGSQELFVIRCYIAAFAFDFFAFQASFRPRLWKEEDIPTMRCVGYATECRHDYFVLQLNVKRDAEEVAHHKWHKDGSRRLYL